MKKHAKERGSCGLKVKNSGDTLGNTKNSFPSNIKKQLLNARIKSCCLAMENNNPP